MLKPRRKLVCSFCGKPADQVRRLIAGPRVFICDACVASCNEILARHPPSVAEEARRPAERPRGHCRWWQRPLAWWSIADPNSRASSNVVG
jgi:hypothetical protein